MCELSSPWSLLKRSNSETETKIFGGSFWHFFFKASSSFSHPDFNLVTEKTTKKNLVTGKQTNKQKPGHRKIGHMTLVKQWKVWKLCYELTAQQWRGLCMTDAWNSNSLIWQCFAEGELTYRSSSTVLSLSWCSCTSHPDEIVKKEVNYFP